MPKEPTSAEIVAAHALRSLPDSISARLALLPHIVNTAPKDSEVRTNARLLLDYLQAHERCQQSLFGGNGR